MNRKLTDEQVAEIRASAESSGTLAPRYGVSATRICEIRQGKARLAEKREASKRWRTGNIEKARKASREANRKRYSSDPAFRAAAIAAVKLYRSGPVGRAAALAAVKRYQAKKRAEREAPLAYKTKSSTTR